jgi:hypothetical protein
MNDNLDAFVNSFQMKAKDTVAQVRHRARELLLEMEIRNDYQALLDIFQVFQNDAGAAETYIDVPPEARMLWVQWELDKIRHVPSGQSSS